jgi:hypothetical protein
MNCVSLKTAPTASFLQGREYSVNFTMCLPN